MTESKKKDWNKIKEEMEALEQAEVQTQAEAESHENALEYPDYSALEEKLTLAEQQAHENWEKATRAVAELDNLRKRTEREVANAHKYGVEKLLQSLLPVVDSLEQALILTENAQDPQMKEGIALTLKLFLDVLMKFEVEQLNPEGEAFNPEQHEAMSIQEAAHLNPNTVMAVFQKGYRLSDRIIRPARVIVSKGKS